MFVFGCVLGESDNVLKAAFHQVAPANVDVFISVSANTINDGSDRMYLLHNTVPHHRGGVRKAVDLEQEHEEGFRIACHESSQ